MLGEPEFPGAPPIIDVEQLILKFARKLEFGDQMYRVANDATTLLRRMRRDWILQGRQPAGLCGACLILAARMNNFRRTVREVVYVVKVADATVSARLLEFKRTQAATLTVDQFRDIGPRLKVKTVPPAVYKRQEREDKKKRKLAELEESDAEVVDDDASETADGDSTLASSADAATAQVSAQCDPQALDAARIPDPAVLASGRVAGTDDIAHLARIAEDLGDTPVQKVPRKRRKADRKIVEVSEEDLEIENDIENEIEDILKDPSALYPEATVRECEKKAQALVEAILNKSSRYVPDTEDIEEGEFADDPEVADCRLTVEEIDKKERIWVSDFDDWLRKRQAKLQKQALEEASGRPKRPQKKRKYSRMGDGSAPDETPASSAAEAAHRMLKKRAKGFSSFVNYDRLQDLFGPADRARSTASGTPSAADATPGAQQSPHPEAAAPRAASAPGPQPTPAPPEHDDEWDEDEEEDEPAPPPRVSCVDADEEVVEDDDETDPAHPLRALGVNAADYFDGDNVGFEDEEDGDY